MPMINFNGQEYENPQAMPPEIRRLYEMAMGTLADRDGNGVPDLLEGALSGAATVGQAMQFVVDGKTYAGLDQLPPEARQRYEEAMQRLDANRDGVPDMLAGMSFMQSSPAVPSPPTSITPSPQVTMVGEGRGMSGAWIAAIAVILVLAGAVVFLLLTR